MSSLSTLSGSDFPCDEDATTSIRVCVAQIGARRRYAVPNALHELGFLECLYTDLYAGNKLGGSWLSFLANRFKSRKVRRLLGRSSDRIPPQLVCSLEWESLLAFLNARRVGKLSEQYALIGKRFAETVAKKGFRNANTVYGFNGGFLESMQVAKSQDLKCVLDQTILPMQLFTSIMRDEVSRWKGWQPDLNLDDDYDQLIERDREEWGFADAIVCGSEYLADAVGKVGGPRHKCRVVPYGFDVVQATGSSDAPPRHRDGKRRLLFVGEVGLRKGVPYLLEAIANLPSDSVELRLAGRVRIASDKLEPYKDFASFLGHIPSAVLAEQYQWADALVMPSLCEGSAMVTYEALARNIPVICTSSTGACLVDGVNGKIIPERNITALSEAIQQLPALLESNAKHVSEMKSAKQINSQSYAAGLEQVLRSVHA